MRTYFLLSGKRTGSTMLGRILDSHSKIAVPFEFAVPSLLGRRHWKYDVALQKARVIGAEYNVSSRLVQAPVVLRYPPLIRRRLELFLSKILEKEGKATFVVKEPNHLAVAERIVSVFGQSSIILLSRGPLSTSSSLFHSFGDTDPLRTWAVAHRVVNALREKGCFLVRYEDLLADPIGEAGRVCAFLGVEFEAEMVEFGRFAHADDRLPLWSRGRGESVLVPIAEAQLHQTVAQGRIDGLHNEECLRRVPPEVVSDYERNAHQARTIAEALGYEELRA